MQTVGSAMAECLNSLKKVVVFEETTGAFAGELSEKWFSLSRELITVWEPERYS